MGHNKSAHEPGAHSPGSGPRILFATLLTQVTDVAAFGKILPEEVGCSGLKRLSILHHCLNTVGTDCARETLSFSLFTLYNRHRHALLRKLLIDIEHLERFLHCFLRSRVNRMAFLPKKLCRAEKDPGPHFPPHHVGPLVDEQRQVTIALHPVAVNLADDRLRCRPDNQRLLEFSTRDQSTLAVRHEPGVSDNRTLLCKAIHMLGLFFDVALGNEQGEIGVLMARVLEHLVKNALHVLPDGVAPRLDDHTPPYRRILGKIGRTNDLLIPLREILLAGGRNCVNGI
ncbi:MAG: hypothetical protein BWY82_01528 [Verrucomicrobia bacterium ADurb.Bin474]|nr:MAG: hypothetical protein BWY82_01528 [Verrucomicrobia bacterium ADurb.Bin474]